MSSLPGRPAVAVIGMAGRFAGADTMQEFWDLLRAGVDATCETPPGRYDVNALYSPTPAKGKVASRRAGYLRGIDRFDAPFFDMPGRDAHHLDPQQRLLMTTAWEALEDAGIPPARIAGSRTGVYVGAAYNDYAELMARRGLEDIDVPALPNLRSLLPARLSFLFDLRGPSICLDTACSSSLLALHLACRSIRAGETTMGLAAGVSIKLVPDRDVLFSRARVVAPDGRSKFGDAAADGAAFSEGVGVIVLKPLDRALADGDRVRAVILGSAVSNDGATSGSLLTPSVAGHAEMLRWAYEDAGVNPADVDFVEAHGNGTPTMDAVEFAALDAVLGVGRPAGQVCFVGSVKTNIGHAESAAGVAGLIKTVLCLEHGQIVPSLHFDTPSPTIAWDSIPLEVPTALRPIPDHGRPAIAGVSGQGISSVNVHLVVGQADPRWIAARPPATAGRQHILALSARTPEALADLVRAYLRYLRPGGAGSGFELRDICYAAAGRRHHHRHRLAILGLTRDAIIAELAAVAQGGVEGVVLPRSADGFQDRLCDLASRYVQGQDPCWDDAMDIGARFVPLPGYPWQSRRYWLDSLAASGRDRDGTGDVGSNAAEGDI